jgi:class 3 adenylate cyclase
MRRKKSEMSGKRLVKVSGLRKVTYGSIIRIISQKKQEDAMKGSNAEIDAFEMKPFEALQEWNRTLLEKVRQQTDLIKRLSRFKRYLPPQLADYILKRDDGDFFKSERREITSIFLDLRGFTAFSDSAEPEEVMALLRSYHMEMGQLIFKFGGTVEHFVADGLMVFFNDWEPCEDHTEKAMRLSLAMRDRVKELRKRWLQKGYDLDLGIGLAAGFAAVGNLGFEGQMDYGAIGNVTNLAARLCGAAKGGQILTDQKTLTRIAPLVETEPLEELYLKGFVRPVRALNVVRLKPRAPKSVRKGTKTILRARPDSCPTA